ncbi:MAG: DUF2332 family protein, partial [Candidatus Promineifilaceae bacterium]|nr:DUF2332 family protein [Candidatus Promineifilaceae bacterium]
MKVDRRARLAARFRRQEAFSQGYSPLYARLFGLVAAWLESGADPLADWLVTASAGRQTLDVTLLLAAGLHREILADHPDAASLATYYPSVGGQRSPTEPAFAATLRQAMWACRDRLAPFIQTATVQ